MTDSSSAWISDSTARRFVPPSCPVVPQRILNLETAYQRDYGGGAYLAAHGTRDAQLSRLRAELLERAESMPIARAARQNRWLKRQQRVRAGDASHGRSSEPADEKTRTIRGPSGLLLRGGS